MLQAENAAAQRNNHRAEALTISQRLTAHTCEQKFIQIFRPRPAHD
jgi:hypothetical protein